MTKTDQSVLKIRDAEFRLSFGKMIAKMPSRYLLSVRTASFFINVYFYRRLLQAVIIIYLYHSVTEQLVCSLYLSLVYTIIILGLRVTLDPIDRLNEVLNELAIIVTIYFLMLFAGEYIVDADMRENLGIALIVFTMLYFVANIFLSIFNLIRFIVLYCRKWYILR